MSPIIEKIFMLQRHQLIRWGLVNGYPTVGLGVLVIVTSIILFPIFSLQLGTIEAQMNENAELQLQVIESRESTDDLKAFAIKASKDNHSESLQLIDMSRTAIEVLFVSIAVTGLLLLGMGMLGFRARELALEADRNYEE